MFGLPRSAYPLRPAAFPELSGDSARSAPSGKGGGRSLAQCLRRTSTFRFDFLASRYFWEVSRAARNNAPRMRCSKERELISARSWSLRGWSWVVKGEGCDIHRTCACSSVQCQDRPSACDRDRRRSARGTGPGSRGGCRCFSGGLILRGSRGHRARPKNLGCDAVRAAFGARWCTYYGLSTHTARSLPKNADFAGQPICPERFETSRIAVKRTPGPGEGPRRRLPG